MEVNGQGVTRDRTEERHNTKTPLRISSKRGRCAPDGNRTIYDYQLVTVLTSGFTSGIGVIFVKSAIRVFLSNFSFTLAKIPNVTGLLGVFI